MRSKVRLYNSNDQVDCSIIGTKLMFKDTYKEERKILIEYKDPVSKQLKEAVYPRSRIKLSTKDENEFGLQISKCVL